MEVKIVLGHLFGDEGKGVTTQWLCEQALKEGKHPIVIRFSGGPQAGHTIRHNGVEHICATYGSGTLLGVPTVVLDYYDPICANNERKVLEEKMGEVPMLYVSKRAKIITPFDVFKGIEDKKILSDGTCGKGLFPTFERYRNNQTYYLMNELENYVNVSRSHEEISGTAICMRELFEQSVREMYPHKGLSIMTYFKRDYDVFIFEGSQGLLLDMENGFMPHCTPAKVGLNGIEEQYLKDAEVYLVARTYLTRHGNGYTPRIPLTWDLSKAHETNVCNKFQGEFKVGEMEPELLKAAFHRHCLDNYKAIYGCRFNLVVTHVDVCPEADTVIKKMMEVYPKGFIEKVYVNGSVDGDIKPYSPTLYGCR